MKIRDIKPSVIRAIEDEKQLDVTYWSEDGFIERVIDPWYLLKKNDYYLFGYCHLKKETRCFHLKRIQKFSISRTRVEKKAIALSRIFSIKRKFLPDFYAEPEKFIAYAYPLKYKDNIKSLAVKIHKEVFKKSNIRDSSKGNESGYPQSIHLSKMIRQAKCRSPLEHKVLLDLESNPEIVSIEVEPLKIQYFYKRVSHLYKPDLLIKYKDGKKDIIEVKLSGDIGSPKNQAKFSAAQEFAKDQGYQFYIIGTEGNSRSYFNRSDWSDISSIQTKMISPNDISDYQPIIFKNEKGDKKNTPKISSSVEHKVKNSISVESTIVNSPHIQKRLYILRKNKKRKRIIDQRRYNLLTKNKIILLQQKRKFQLNNKDIRRW